MADRLSRIYGTEEDRVNCPFYFKIGACRHGEKCSRAHNRPAFSQTILVRHMWANPRAAAAVQQYGGAAPILNEQALNDDFDDFYEEVYDEVSKLGEIDELNIAGNIGDHLVGNVYIKFYDEEDAQTALQTLQGRYYTGRQMLIEYSPVTDFREARCRQFDENKCNRGGLCNFMHLIQPHPKLKSQMRKLGKDLKREREKNQEPEEKERSRSRERERKRSRSRDRDRDRDRDRRR